MEMKPKAEGLEDGGDAVAQVRAKKGHGDDVEEDDEGILESFDDHFPWAGFAEGGEFAIGADGEVKNVEDDEGEDGESAPDHDAGGFGGLDGGVVGVFRACCFVLFGEENGEEDVRDEADKKANAGDPDSHAVKEGVEEFGVFVKGFFTCEDEEVSREVAG